MGNLNSCLYELLITHERSKPKRNRFAYRAFMFCLDLAELEEISRTVKLLRINSPGIYSFHDKDHFEHSALYTKDKLLSFLTAKGVTERPERIMFLTNLRFLGYVFNPISIFFVTHNDNLPLCSVAEVGNTFKEKKIYLVPTRQALSQSQPGTSHYYARMKKLFYVSPFSELDLDFEFLIGSPQEFVNATVNTMSGDERIVSARIAGKRVELTDRNLLYLTFKYPFITLKVISLIHWQALKLWFKGVPHIKKEDQPAKQVGVIREEAVKP